MNGQTHDTHAWYALTRTRARTHGTHAHSTYGTDCGQWLEDSQLGPAGLVHLDLSANRLGNPGVLRLIRALRWAAARLALVVAHWAVCTVDTVGCRTITLHDMVVVAAVAALAAVAAVGRGGGGIILG